VKQESESDSNKVYNFDEELSKNIPLRTPTPPDAQNFINKSSSKLDELRLKKEPVVVANEKSKLLSNIPSRPKRNRSSSSENEKMASHRSKGRRSDSDVDSDASGASSERGARRGRRGA